MNSIMFVLYVLSFLVTGLWLAVKAQQRKLLPKEFLYIGVIAASLVIYYAIFYAYLIKPSVAGLIVKLLIVVSIGLAVDLVITVRKSKDTLALLKKYFLPPLLITAAIMFIYCTLFYSCVPRKPAQAGYQEIDNRTFCYTSKLPFDNSLGFIFGQNILRNEDKKQAIDWNMVDRPPLQIAATLPILDSQASQAFKYVGYHLFSVFLQLSWVGAFWGIFQILKIKKKYQVYTFVGFATTGFFFLNSIFVWPKLLAASMVFTGVMMFLGKKNKEVTYSYLPFAAILLALGLLSHAGVLFTIVPFAGFLAIRLVRAMRTKKINYSYVALAAVLAIAMLAPWYAYKGSVVKNDRLIKWHFAGITMAEDTRGTAPTIVEEYKKMPSSELIHNKVLNVKTLYTGGYNGEADCPAKLSSVFSKCIYTEWRSLTFFSTVFAFEAFTIGWFAFGYRVWKRRVDQLDKELLIIIGLSLLFWVLTIFIPGGTIVHAGSYATMMLMFLFLAKNLSDIALPFLATSTVLQTIIFYLAWVSAYHIAP